MSIFDKMAKKTEERNQSLEKVVTDYTSWSRISTSSGWKIYQERIDKEFKLVENKLLNDTSLDEKSLKELQRELQVWKKVKKIPKDLEEKAKKGVKK